MMKLLSLFAFLSLSLGLCAQEKSTLGDELSSPITTPAVIVFSVGSLATLATLVLEDKVVDPTQQELTEDKPLGRWHSLGDWGGKGYLNGAYILLMAMDAGLSSSKTSYNRSALMFKATLYSLLASTSLKGIVREPRPNNPSEKSSFPSGHTTAAFAFATTVAAIHPWYWGLGAFALASLTAVSRMNDNRHYLHDVIAGATIGSSYALGLYILARRDGKKFSKSSSYSSYYFLPDESLKGIQLGYQRWF